MNISPKQLFIKRKYRIKNGLTYALGAKCRDGLVLVADKRISETSGEIRYSDKTYFISKHMLMASSGPSREDFELFLNKFQQRKHELSQKTNGWTSINAVKDLISKIIYNYHEEEHRIFQTLFISIQYQDSTIKPELVYFNDYGGIRKIDDYYVIGQGEPLGRLFLQKIFNSDLSMKQVSILSTFIILFIEKLGLDDSVGIEQSNPTIYWIPNVNEGNIKRIERKILEEIKNSAEKMFELYNDCSNKFFKESKDLLHQPIPDSDKIR